MKSSQPKNLISIIAMKRPKKRRCEKSAEKVGLTILKGRGQLYLIKGLKEGFTLGNTVMEKHIK